MKQDRRQALKEDDNNVVDHEFIKRKRKRKGKRNETNCAREGIVLQKHLKSYKVKENVTDFARESIGHLRLKKNCRDRGNVINFERGSIGHLSQQKNWHGKGCVTCCARGGIVPPSGWRLRTLLSIMYTCRKVTDSTNRQMSSKNVRLDQKKIRCSHPY